MQQDAQITDEELSTLNHLLGRLREMPADDPTRLRAERVARSFVRDGRRARRTERRTATATADRQLAGRTATGGADRREDAPLARSAPDGPIGTYLRGQRCYICKGHFRLADAFYHQLCPDCAAENAARRTARTDLSARRALLTGGRVKIGFQLALMLLRDGAELIVTTRFPHDAARRLREAPDSAEWTDRLTIVGIDLRDPRQVLGFCDRMLAEARPLDILVNNAAQTVRRPPESYALLADGERTPAPIGSAPIELAPGFTPMPALTAAWPTAQIEGRPHDPVAAAALPVAAARGAIAAVDEAGLLPDPAAANSWSARLGDLDPGELLETHLVNAIAPALLCDRLLPLLLASPHARRYIVNVTAVEGRFAVRNKTPGHPHTNMAKAALNMLTRTSAAELATQGVYLSAVDTGWITDENPAPKKSRLADRGFRTPLDVVDGAARVYDPIVRGEAGDPVHGVFLKDYREAAW